MSAKPNKRPWRKLVKHLQRKRRRQKSARQRDKELKEVELEKLNDPLYKLWLENQEAIQRQQQLEEENEGHEQEQLWLRRELLAQKQFERDKLKRQAQEADLEAERLKQEKNLKLLEDARQKKREEIKLLAEKALKDFDDMMTCMQEYLEDNTMKTPARLEYSVQSRPGEKPCDFFDKTNCCRFGTTCSFNHKRPLLSNIILVKHFFQHPLLEKEMHEEYSRSDSELEFSERDLRESYDEFCEDVWPVLEEFGKVMNFRTVRNVQAHLRGHVFVEYAEKRSALKSFINLQNRYYASKRLNVEFSNIRQWHKGVCGMRSFFEGLSLGRKCPKGVKCNFLHLMKNVDNKYNNPIDNPERSLRSVSKSAKAASGTPSISWNSEDIQINKTLQSRNWRWSESPEIELKTKNNEGNLKIKTDSEKKNSSSSPRRSFPRRISRSISPTLDYNKHTRKSRSNSPNKNSRNPRSRGHRHHKNKQKSESEKRVDLRSNSKAERETKEKQKCVSSSLRNKSSHRRSSRSNHNHKRANRSRSKSPSKASKQRNDKNKK